MIDLIIGWRVTGCVAGEVPAFARWKGLASDAGAEGRVGVEPSETA